MKRAYLVHYFNTFELHFYNIFKTSKMFLSAVTAYVTICCRDELDILRML